MFLFTHTLSLYSSRYFCRFKCMFPTLTHCDSMTKGCRPARWARNPQLHRVTTSTCAWMTYIRCLMSNLDALNGNSKVSSTSVYSSDIPFDSPRLATGRGCINFRAHQLLGAVSDSQTLFLPPIVYDSLLCCVYHGKSYWHEGQTYIADAG